MSDYRKILAATDFSAQALPGIEEAATLARRLGSRIVLVFVVEDHLPPLVGTLTLDEREGILESQRKNAGEKIEEYAAQHLAGLEVETAALAGVASQEIVRYAEDHDVDLIVMASRGYGPLRQILIGSTAERVLHHASCPVLIVPSRKG